MKKKGTRPKQLTNRQLDGVLRQAKVPNWAQHYWATFPKRVIESLPRPASPEKNKNSA
jgi:hypothetical protein